VIACVAKDLASGRMLSSHDDMQLPSYSTIEVLLAAAIWRMVARGELDEAELALRRVCDRLRAYES
jgi:hypothetical protein